MNSDLGAQIDLLTNLMTPTLVMLAMMFGYIEVRSWRREQRERLELERMQMESRLQSEAVAREQVMVTVGQEALKGSLGEQGPRDSGGYIILNLPEEHRSLFIDLLKGFEEFALLKGYRVLFSFDSTTAHQVAFKFTVADSGITVSTERVKRDFDDYIARIRSGEPLDDLPVVIHPTQHDLLLTTMKNRINFLQHNHNLTRNTVEYYERLLQSGGAAAAFRSAPTVVVQTGDRGRLGFDTRTYTALDSPQVVQGDENAGITQHLDQGIRIAGSFNERRSQIAEVERLIQAVRSLPQVGDAVKGEVVANLKNVTDELEHQEKPDPGRIKRWLETTKLSLENVKLTKDVVEIAKAAYASFNLASMISHLPWV